MSDKDARETSADRWSSWRRGATVSVTPADTRLYRVVTCDAERIIGLCTTQLSLKGGGCAPTDSASGLLAHLNQRGNLRVQAYRISGNAVDGWRAESTGQVALFANQTKCIEPFDPSADLEHLSDAA